MLLISKKKYINTTHKHHGRLGNLFFVGMTLHFIAQKNNLRCEYKEYNKLKKLGIELFIGEYIYNENIILSDSNFYDIIIIVDFY